jgi:hypothetical protein
MRDKAGNKGWRLSLAYDIVPFHQTARERHLVMLKKDGSNCLKKVLC